ncbi:HD domain-containing protein, partial [bacterium]
MASEAEKAVINRFTLELGRLYQAYRMYPPGVPHVLIAAEKCSECLREYGKPIRISRMGEDVILEEEILSPVPKQLEKILEAFNAFQWDSVRFEPEMGQRGLVELMRHLKEGTPGPYHNLGFVAGTINVDSGEEGPKTGYFTLTPKVSDMMEDVMSGRKSTWVRAREITRLITSHVMGGQSLFDPIMALKDYDEYTYTHALNVAAISIAVARMMELPETLVDSIGIGALCHDVGKQNIPYEILRKPGRLDDAEREMMNRHPVDGAAILVGFHGDVPPIVPVIAFQHHLRIDGSGYPQMPVHATPHPAPMLVAVADTFDAVRTVRPYQPRAYT